MLIGYVSDEKFLALADALVEFDGENGQGVVVRTSPIGAINADLDPGEYKVRLHKDGYGAKTASLQLQQDHVPVQFRLLSDTLLGYAWPKWAKSGEVSEYRVHSPEECQVSLWRYGQQKERVRIIAWHGEHGPRAGIQITPDGDYTQTGVQWNKHGYTNPHHGQGVVAPERSGLYYFHLKGKSGAFFSFPWVVAPAAPTAPIAVLASTTNWNAYNSFGGRSNYIHSHELPPKPTMNARLELDRYLPQANTAWFFRFENHEYRPLSFDRPEPLNHIPEHVQATDPIEGRQECHNAPTEWRLLAWLEREGFNYDLYAESHLHFDELDLDAYKVLVLSTHPEYWSVKMYKQVKEWVFERGGRLIYLGGNGIEGPVDFLDRQTMRCLNQWVNVDNSGENREGTYEGRFHREFESAANLLGTVCDGRGIMTGAPYQVLDDTHWAFAGTGLKTGDLFGVESLHERCHGGASGHETDKRSRSAPPNTRLLAKGTNPDNGGAEMVAFETPSGGEVFSAGSITYPASVIVDEPLSRVTRNVLTRFLREDGVR